MKRNKLGLAVALLTLTLLAGCASNSAAPAPETTAKALPETTAAVPETTASVVTPGETEAAQSPAAESAPFAVEITPVITGQQNQVTVATADEFLAAIAPNTEITLNAELIDLSEASGYGETNG